LTQVMTRAAYDHMLSLAAYLAESLRQVIAGHDLKWHVTQIGSRGEFICADKAPRNGTEARAAMQGPLEQALHLFCINRGVLIAPFHNMTLVSPATTKVQVDRLASVVDECLTVLNGTQR
jgi:glutamate-1-semialdehyde 2,1-aminomutase